MPDFYGYVCRNVYFWAFAGRIWTFALIRKAYICITILNLLLNIMNNLQSIVSHFNTKGTVNEIQPLGSGLINDTYKVTTLEADAPDYVLQRINHAIFQNVEMLQANIEAVTRHIRKKLTEQGADDIDRKVLSFIPADTGKTYWYDGENAI